MTKYTKTFADAMKEVRKPKVVKEDYEVSMAIGQLKTIQDRIGKIMEFLSGKSDDYNMEAWLQSKITSAEDKLNSVANYVTNNPEVNEANLNVDNVSKGDTDKEKELKIKLDKEKDQDTLEAQITTLKGQLALVKNKLENEKNRVVKPEANPETGEVPLRTGLANAILDKKMDTKKLVQTKKKDEVKAKITNLDGKLLIKYFPPKGVSVKRLQQHIEKMVTLDNKPDVIIVDYADLLLSHSNKSDSTYAEQGGVYIDLRGMSGELEIPIWTASQTNRSAIDSEVIEADKIADSYAKVMNADFIMSVSRKSKDKLNDTARAHIMKNRFGPDGITFPMKMNTNTGYMEVYDGTSPDGVIATKQSASGQLETKKLLHKKYVENMG